MRKLYRFFWDCGRMGDVEGLFVATPEQIEKSLGKDVYFGEILGKHSEIYGTLEDGDLDVVSEDQEFIDKLTDLLSENVSGYNPLDHMEEEEEYL